MAFIVSEANYITNENEHISANELVIRRGASSESTDGHLVRMDEFLIKPLGDMPIIDLPLRVKDGRLIQVEFVCNVCKGADEKVFHCDIRDTADHKKALNALLKSEILL